MRTGQEFCDHTLPAKTVKLLNSRRQRGSVGIGAGLVIVRLRNLGSTPDAVARRCVFGKDT